MYTFNIPSSSRDEFPSRSVPLTERLAVSEYKLGETGITIPKGMIISIPVYAMHKDSKFFPDPEKFDPDRFIQKEKSKREQYTYLPFGAGPRNCIGMRFALVEIKVCLAYILANYKISKCSQSSQTKVNFRHIC
ncbi:Cytochrome P450 6j1 [Araneus ventricosus]|uniref:Cytochrome P450 6j1 n=1 Tax=Araneus ventricosus TaxID=182803 RepID=A0A4Y2FSJ0_ARAVE|nr:Cytochrome P450 6j1 [Araneus ventricosus]GBM43435.1 Cytochrome P450 6j1 [Araneus ventricosus]